MILDCLHVYLIGGSVAAANAGVRVEVAQPEIITYARVSKNIAPKKIRYIQLPVVSVHKRFVRHHPLKSILKRVKKVFG